MNAPKRASGFAVFVAAVFVLVTLPAGAGAQDATPLFELTDPPGDGFAGVRGTGQEAGSPGAASPQSDVRAFRILRDDGFALLFEVELEDLATAQQRPGSDPQLYFRFQPEGSVIWYHVLVDDIGDAPSLLGSSYGREPDMYFCIKNDNSDPFDGTYWYGGEGCTEYNRGARVLREESLVRITVPKQLMMGQGGYFRNPILGVPKFLDIDTALTGWFVAGKDSYGYSSLSYVGVEDRLDAADQVYRMRSAVEDTIIRVSIGNDEHEMGLYGLGRPTGDPNADARLVTQSIAPGQQLALPLSVYSQAEGKRIVNLTTRITDGSPSEWRVQLAGNIEVPRDDSRTVTLLVGAPTGLVHRQTADVEILATSLGHTQEVSRLTLRLVGSGTPSPETPTLYFHASTDNPGATQVWGYSSVCTDQPTNPICYTREYTWLNTLAQDDYADPDRAVANEGNTDYLFPDRVYRRYFAMDSPLAQGLWFLQDGLVKGTIAFSAAQAMDAEVRLTLYTSDRSDCGWSCYGAQFLSQGKAATSITSTPAATNVQFLLPPEASDLSKQGRYLIAEVAVHVDEGSTAFEPNVAKIRFHPAESQFTLPLVKPPAEAILEHSLLGLYPVGDVEEFVNPGKSRTFNVLLGNEGVDTYTVKVNMGAPLGWAGQVQPASRYQLAPGQSVNLTILVQAPTNATEGEIGLLRLQAASESGPERSSPLQLRAIATKVDLGEPSAQPVVDPDAQTKALPDESVESPGAALALVLAAVGGSLALARRRRL